MTGEEIQARILGALPGAEVEVRDITGTGDHYEARVVSESFAGRAMIEQHKLVYGALDDVLKTGELHALALKTFSPDQWAKAGRR
ncbi:MAG: BolA/IbaG family iron-sulfur metabolism protein [Myxococcota bacterium]|nr:BolA/IbaG family iron-sulfur metabolism protein [Myxococcota bacterium]